MSTITHEQERTPAQKEYDEKVRDRVLRGLKWLEETHGPGWEDKINLATLKLSDGAHCVLGQVYKKEANTNTFTDYNNEKRRFYNGYHYADESLGMKPNEAIKHGFLSGADVSYSALQDCWEDVLTPKVNPGS